MSNLLLRERFYDTYFLCFDFETEGLNQYLHRPWQLFFFISRGSKILEQHNIYIKWPDLNVSPEAAAVTGFDQRIIDEKGQDPHEALAFFDSCLYRPEYLIVGANIINYDAMIHNTWRRAFGIYSDWSWLERLYDTNCIARMWKENLQFNRGDNWLLFQYKLNNLVKKGLKTSVGTLAKEFNIPHDPKTLHMAHNDVPVTFEIFKQLVFKTEI